jgi:phosphatidylethanolamine/phosphatidyl-N-methylethanolamine N-methyltransferase
MMLSDMLNFLSNVVRDPKRVSAIAPSSPALAKLMTRDIVASHAPVIELGPGTGVFTRRLIERGIPEDQLTLVELGREFSDHLAKRFPAATILNIDAGRLNGVAIGNGQGVGAVVSGLPLLSMSPLTVMRILRSAFAHLRSDGAFYQFTYGPRCPVPLSILKRLGLRATRMGWVIRNLPPAFVYRISRDPAASRRART